MEISKHKVRFVAAFRMDLLLFLSAVNLNLLSNGKASTKNVFRLLPKKEKPLLPHVELISRGQTVE